MQAYVQSKLGTTAKTEGEWFTKFRWHQFQKRIRSLKMPLIYLWRWLF